MERESHPIMKEIIKHKITHKVNRLKTSLKWVVFAILSGVLVGSVGTLFYLCMALVTLVRTKNPWLIFLLPVGGILIVGAYRLLHDERDTGTNLVLSAIPFRPMNAAAHGAAHFYLDADHPPVRRFCRPVRVRPAARRQYWKRSGTSVSF